MGVAAIWRPIYDDAFLVLTQRALEGADSQLELTTGCYIKLDGAP
jgi:hypothetical protein